MTVRRGSEQCRMEECSGGRVDGKLDDIQKLSTKRKNTNSFLHGSEGHDCKSAVPKA